MSQSTLTGNSQRSPSGSTKNILTPSKPCCGVSHVSTRSRCVSACVCHRLYVTKISPNSPQKITLCVFVCIPGCDEEPQCSVADLRDADSAQFHSCSLYPDSQECGGYENPRRQNCALVLQTSPDNTYSKTGNQPGKPIFCELHLHHLTEVCH